MNNFFQKLFLFVLLSFFVGCSGSKSTDSEDLTELLSEEGAAVSEEVPEEKTSETIANAEEKKEGEEALPEEAADVSQERSIASASTELEDYQVHAGDTLMKIAFERLGDLYAWKKILAWNQKTISDPNQLKEGTVIQVPKRQMLQWPPKGNTYAIMWGDTLSKISQKVYQDWKKWKVLWKNNKLMIHDPNKIYAGFTLYYIPLEELPTEGAPNRPLASVKEKKKESLNQKPPLPKE